MKNLIIGFIAFLLSLSACKHDQTPMQVITPEGTTYIDSSAQRTGLHQHVAERLAAILVSIVSLLTISRTI